MSEVGATQEPTNPALSEAERRFFAEDPELDPYDLSTIKPRPKPLVIFLATVVILACSYLLFDMRAELRYFFQSRTPQALGDLDESALRDQTRAGDLPSDVFASLQGTPNYPAFMWRSVGGLGRGPGPGEHARLVVFPLRDDAPVPSNPIPGIRHIGETVQLTYLPLAVLYNEQDDYPREHLRGDFTGRLIRVGDAPFLSTIRPFLWKNFALELPEESYLLIDGESPGNNWVYAAVSGVALLAIFYNLWVIVKQLRRGRVKPA